MLLALVQQWSRYLQAQDKLAGHGLVVQGERGQPCINPFLLVADKALTQCRRLWIELGLTPSSRSRIARCRCPDVDESLVQSLMTPATHYLLMTGRQADQRCEGWVQLAIDVVTAEDHDSLRRELWPHVAGLLEAEAAPFHLHPVGSHWPAADRAWRQGMGAAVSRPPHVLTAPPTRIDVGARIAALEHELRELRQQLHEQLLVTIAGIVGDRAFSARELWQHAQQVSLELREAFDQAGITSTRQLGKRLQRIGRENGGGVPTISLERLGADHDGAVWRVRVLTDSQGGPSYRDPCGA